MLYFILGTLVSIPISVFATPAYNRLQRLRAARSHVQALKRHDMLAKQIEELTYHKNHPLEVILLVGQKILVLTLLSFVPSIASLLMAVLASGVFGGPLLALVNAISSVTGIIFFSIALRLGLRTWRLAAAVSEYDKRMPDICAELDSLRQQLGEYGAVQF